MTLYTYLLEHVPPNKKNNLLQNPNTVITFKKSNLATINHLLYSPCSNFPIVPLTFSVAISSHPGSNYESHIAFSCHASLKAPILLFFKTLTFLKARGLLVPSGFSNWRYMSTPQHLLKYAHRAGSQPPSFWLRRSQVTLQHWHS